MNKILFILALAIPLSTHGAVLGSFTCQNKIRSVVKANGKTVRQTNYSSSLIVYNNDGTITGTTPISPFVSHGTWSQKGRAIFVYPDINDQARDAIYGCSLTGANCIFVGATSRSKGISNKYNNIIKGTGIINLTMLVNGIIVNNNATSTFTCRK